MANKTDSNQEEIWRPIPEWEGFYEVSNHGQVRSLERMARHRGGFRRVPPKILKQHWNNGYWRLKLARDGERETKYVHQLVCAAFHGPREEGMQVAHWDGDARNNKAENLRWATHQENVMDKLRHGTHNSNGKLRAGAAMDIRQSMNAELVRLSEKYNVSLDTVRSIYSYRTWQHI